MTIELQEEKDLAWGQVGIKILFVKGFDMSTLTLVHLSHEGRMNQQVGEGRNVRKAFPHKRRKYGLTSCLKTRLCVMVPKRETRDIII